ncbi:class I SAM-dependent methyltransferase [Rickettsiella endosymbiont of Dermanyssus gallinae]|uniref:class I SAM-dependent methyltransferase n=1 Tax=Rickettsiella endosymbiont of Dermanyssus gallinae TaxID=2856608 RepID=UPI001C52CFBC|nr:class I SAM-dependent methyltransferase [Rickettsiella endosymbiont of Dermanyssus gallinae]
MTSIKKGFIAVTASEPQQQLAAQNLAKQYFLPYIDSSQQEKFSFVLVLSEKELMLKNIEQKDWGNLQIDFLKGSIGYRLRHVQGQKQLLAKAIGSKTPPKASILDLTAGLGKDGFIFAQLGFTATLLERSPIIAALLQDGLDRALSYKSYSACNIQLIHSEAKTYLSQMDTEKLPDIIYLDPMYPHSTKSALVKKEMRFLRQIVGDDTDSQTLLPLALTHARKRVIVKRARSAPFLSELKPQHSIFGKKLRFDIYLTPMTCHSVGI